MFRKFLSSAAAIAVFGLLGMSQLASADDCDTGCCKKTCTPVTETRKVADRCYSVSCEEFCLPKCNLAHAWFRGWWPREDHCSCCATQACDKGCDDCGCCDKCGRVMTRRDLVVKIKVHEETVHKCVPTCCATGCCAAPAAAVPALPAPKSEVIPAPKAAPAPKGDSEVLMLEDGAPGVAHTMSAR